MTPQLDGRLPQRFWDKVIVSRRTGCWLWTGARSEKGYAKYYHQGQMWRAHRLVYEVAVGPIPKGMQIDHVRARGCSSTGCVNPQHLEAVSCQENLLRGDTLAAANASKTHCHRGHRFPSGRRGKCLDCERDQIERKKGLGRCFSCPGSALPGTTRCLACRDRNRERSRERGRSRIRSRRR